MDVRGFHREAELLRRLARLVQLAGSQTILMRRAILNDYFGTINFLYDLSEKDEGVHLNAMRFKIGRELPGFDASECLIVGRLAFEGKCLAYYAVAECFLSFGEEGLLVNWGLTSLRNLEIGENSEMFFDRFKQDAQAETGLSLLFGIGSVTESKPAELEDRPAEGVEDAAHGQ